MAEKPPEEGYISVVDEEPEFMELLKWDAPPIEKQLQNPACAQTQSPEKPIKAAKRPSRSQECDPFDLPEPTFMEMYRLSKDLAHCLIAELKEVVPESNKSFLVSAEARVLAALSFYATGKFQKPIIAKNDLNVNAYYVSSAVIQVTEAMNHPTIVKKYIHFPHLREERDIIKARFYVKYGMPNIIGCIDCTHVPLAPPGEDKTHFNKSFHSKKVQIICDSDYTVISVDPSPGSSSHDGILSRHAVKVDLESLNNAGEECFLVGGPNYSVKPYIMTPIPKISKKSPASPEKYYNSLHTQTHSTVTETIKHLKSRWKCLQATCNKQFDAPIVSMMVVACCILNNMCNRRGLPICQMTGAEERLEIMKQKVANGSLSKKLNDDDAGKQVRAQLVERLWNERRVVPENNAPRKRMSKKDRLLEGYQNEIQSQMQVQPQHSQLEDPSKRQRLAINPPSYGMMPPTWSQYPPHH